MDPHQSVRARVRRLSIAMLAFGVLGACERAKSPPPVDSAATVLPPPAESTAPPPMVSWGRHLGDVLVLFGGDSATVSVVVPGRVFLQDTTSFNTSVLEHAPVDLFRPGGLVGQGTLVDVTLSPDRPCPSWPSGLIAPAGITGALPSWSFGLGEHRAIPIPMQSLDSLPQADSAQLAAELARIASALPTDTVFRGIPFVVGAAYRFSPVPGVTTVAAELVRRLPQEATPQEEHIFVVAERDSTASRYRAVYSTHSSGSETEVTAIDILGAVQLLSIRHPILVLDAVHYEGDVYVVLERTATGWERRWSSPYAGC